MDEKKLDKLNKLLEIMKDDVVSPAEIQKFLTVVLQFITKSKTEFQNLSQENLQKIDQALNKIEQDHKANLASVSQVTSETEKNITTEFNARIKEIKSLMEETLLKKPKDGLDAPPADENKIIESVIEKLPKHKDVILDSGEEIKVKLEILKGEDRLDASAIKNLPKGKGFFGGTMGIKEIVAGTNITVDNTNLGYPVINSTGGGTPGGSNTQVQFNDSGAFGGDSGLVYNKLTKTLGIGPNVTADALFGLTIRGYGGDGESGIKLVNSDFGNWSIKNGAGFQTSLSFFSEILNDDTFSIVVDLNNNVQIGVKNISPTASLHLPAVGTGASTAPLKLTLGGTLMTTPEAGAIEAINTHLYWTSSAGTRFQLDQQGSGGGETLAQTLVLGNATGGTSITMTSGDKILSPSGAGAIVVEDTFLDLSTDSGVHSTPYIRIDTTSIGLNIPSGVGLIYANASSALLSHTTLINFISPAVRFSSLTASTVPYLDASKNLVSSAVTPTQLSYLDATSSIQTQINALTSGLGSYLPLAGGTMTGDIKMAANKLITSANGTSIALVLNNSYLKLSTDADTDDTSYLQFTPTSFQLNQKAGGSLVSTIDVNSTRMFIAGTIIELASPVKLSQVVGTGAGTAPLKFVLGGTLMTAPEAGAVEATNTHLYWTSSAGTRYQLDQQGGGAGTLSATLALGNTTGGHNIVMTAGDFIKSPSGTGSAISVEDSLLTLSSDGGVNTTPHIFLDAGAVSIYQAASRVIIMDASHISINDPAQIQFVAPAYNFNSLTPSQIAAFDGSSNLVSLAVATYPSLTELSYVKGVTSAIQTQLGTLTTSVAAKLPLAGGIMVGDIYMTSNKIIGGSTTTSDLYLQTTSAVGATGADMHFLVGSNGGTEAMTILNSGFVGIGTIAPNTKFHVENNANSNTALEIVNTTSGTLAQETIYLSQLVNPGTTCGQLSHFNTSFTASGVYQPNSTILLSADTGGLWLGASDGAGKIHLFTGGVAAGNERMTIDSAGLVGIGVTSPTAILHLKAGTATANTAPLKFNSGTLLATAEAGGVEFLTDKFYGTITTGAARKTFAFLESPVFTTPSLGVATATSINGNTFTTGTYTLTGQAGKTLTFNGSITLTGTDAQTYTFPTTTATLARTDAANTFTGASTASAWVLTSPTITTKISPTTDDGAPLGDTTHNFSDLFLASGGVINFANGNATINHSSGVIYFDSANFAIQKGSGDIVFNIDALAGSTATGGILIRGGSYANRWYVFKDGTAESGSNVGSDFAIQSFSDAGSLLATAFKIKRSNAQITMSSLAGTGSRAVIADANGVLTAPVSDLTVKENIAPLDYGLKEIMALNPVSFTFKEGWQSYGEGKQIGAIAQEVEKIIPEVTFTSLSTGKMGISYEKLIPVLIKAIQELQEQINKK